MLFAESQGKLLSDQFAAGINPPAVADRSDSESGFFIDPQGIRTEHFARRKMNKMSYPAMKGFLQDIDGAQRIYLKRFQRFIVITGYSGNSRQMNNNIHIGQDPGQGILFQQVLLQ